MFRAIFIYLSKAAWARKMVTGLPFARRAATRFVAGETLDQGLAAIQRCQQNGLYATLDHLGENVCSVEEAQTATEHYLEIYRAIAEAGLPSSASLKLSQMGLPLGIELAYGNVLQIVSRAAQLGNFVRIDMEDSSTIDDTLAIYQRLRKAGFNNVGLVIQSYLYRSDEDVQRLLQDGCTIRLCKGAYKEPAELAYPAKADVDQAFDRLTAMMIDYAAANGSIPSEPRKPPVTAVASHDLRRIEFAKAYARKVGLPKHALEFQMLHGIRADLQQSLAAEGYPVRVYIPYGTEWYPYFMRRLAERPANLWFFLSNYFRK